MFFKVNALKVFKFYTSKTTHFYTQTFLYFSREERWTETSFRQIKKIARKPAYLLTIRMRRTLTKNFSTMRVNVYNAGVKTPRREVTNFFRANVMEIKFTPRIRILFRAILLLISVKRLCRDFSTCRWKAAGNGRAGGEWQGATPSARHREVNLLVVHQSSLTTRHRLGLCVGENRFF